ncbi:methylamine utilization protein [Aestuariibacter salexigens]|uniref:methylamine utilization protein n=1 Tax=Aestuariibacter salexigens TaxID=226010 RepID=UPI00041831A9|nr:methylamine utilization protein [Aestuariibacter salexigens]
MTLNVARFLTLLAAIALPITGNAITFRVIDQEGNPVENAVISVTQKEATPHNVSDMAIMDQVDKQFLPKVLVVKAGQRVAFPNSDDIRHHVYSFSEPKPFEIRLYKGTEAAPVLFDKPGIVVLGCNIHDQMVGYIYVTGNELISLTDANGTGKLEVQELNEVTIWHSRLSVSHAERQTLPVVITDGTATLSLELLPEQEAKQERTFGSRKFGRG